MPWKETDPAEQRKAFVDEWLKQEDSISALCERFGISRETGHKWIRRFREDGQRGLEERSRAPLNHPNAASAQTREVLLAARLAHPTWGPRKLLDYLHRTQPQLVLPAPSTVGDLLKRAGCIQKRRRTRAPVRAVSVRTTALEPNAVWAIDFKGWFRTGDSSRCNPLTVTDLFSRYLLACRHVDHGSQEYVQPALERLFREYGLPWAMRSDNGPPFGARGLAGFSRLNVWLTRLGVRIEHIEPGKPQQNGSHERMHRTLSQETTKPPSATLREQQLSFDRFRLSFNEERPHEALGGASPSSLYIPSARSFPSRLPELVYPDEYRLRRVRNNGQIKWGGGVAYLGEAFVGEVVGLQQRTETHWLVYFGPVPIGVLDTTALLIQGDFNRLLSHHQQPTGVSGMSPV